MACRCICIPLSKKKKTGKRKMEINGYLEVDYNRGVIYFHQTADPKKQPTLLRVCNIRPEDMAQELIDITTGITPGIRERA